MTDLTASSIHGIEPATPAIPDIYEGMFDHCATIAQAQSEWNAIRTVIPQWHDGGETRGRVARIATARWDALRNHGETAAK